LLGSDCAFALTPISRPVVSRAVFLSCMMECFTFPIRVLALDRLGRRTRNSSGARHDITGERVL
jgi:hypothetical protein